jgi:hypothetical protein
MISMAKVRYRSMSRQRAHPKVSPLREGGPDEALVADGEVV